MSSSNTNQVNELFPGLDKITQGYTGSLNSEASVYGYSQPAGSSASTTQKCVFSPLSSSMALFAHHAQTAANPNNIAILASRASHLSHGITNGSPNPETANQIALSGSQGRHTLPSANQPARCRRKLITPEIVLEMVEKQRIVMNDILILVLKTQELNPNSLKAD
ncbi:hypothetical protein DSO57_1039577 [Entomophthora muscae]|uniref:Uncharacterized protein n=1 Tax=Entomophthora muscae TaxID=34485 RepID=A0ACC2TKH3_9FUNG|nr:hypothetical protein DSO57_1039577 [Entomophthora muscae]